MDPASANVQTGRTTPSLISRLKNLVVRPGSKPRVIKFGPFKGIRLNLDLACQTQIWLGLSERELFWFLCRIGDRAKTGVDIGALDGEYALYFLKRPGMKHVFACDPCDRFPENLRINLELNGLSGDPRVQGVFKFIGSAQRENMCTADSLAGDLEGPCIVKIDVEGGEADVLRGAQKLLARKDVFWIIETHAPELETECDQILRSAGLKTQIVKNAWWRVILPELRTRAFNRWLVAWSDELERA